MIAFGDDLVVSAALVVISVDPLRFWHVWRVTLL